jgi:ribosomal protein S18 acetylase RimI-like enzyme
MTFEKRKAYLLKKTQRGVLHVDLAFDEATGEVVGYLVSSVVEKTGEIESVFVHAKYRHMGVGGSLMQNALAWMEQQGATSKIVEVSVGNEGAFGFYGGFGFLPRKTVLQQPENSP